MRFEVYGKSSDVATASARLMTRAGGTLVLLSVSSIAGRPERYQIDLPLGATARGQFMIAIEASGSGEQVQSIVPLRIAG